MQKHDIDQRMFQQNKMAALGEMLDNIAHQWRQPLMEINSLLIPIEAQIKLQEQLDAKEVLDAINRVNGITQYMSKTIDDFRNFFAKDKKAEEFKISDQLTLSLNIMGMALKQNNIQVDIILKKNPLVLGYKNEYAQVLINIINNAKDILIQRHIVNPEIKIIVEQDVNKNAVLSIEDNAGGISSQAIEKIFDPFFSYEKQNGTGLGLFMSKLITENSLGGTLSAINTTKGAKFIINIPKTCSFS